ncbi:MAG: DUF3969 family protein [Labilithrix sp.]|nr:DUF3969 family protein [Labilithrix sp.]
MITTFVTRGDQEFQRFVAVLGLGMCRAIASGTVSVEFACERLFGPAVITRAKNAGATPKFVEALTLASELADVGRLVPHAFEASLADVEARLVDILRSMGPGELEAEKWLVTRPADSSDPS